MFKTKHGACANHRFTPEYRSWRAMRERCTQRNHVAFDRYGGRGVTICERWSDFQNFLDDMGPRPSAEHSLDRIDPSKGYEPTNCRWATPKEQGRNRRTNRTLTIDGVTRCIAEWSEIGGVLAWTISRRVDRFGWSARDAVFTPTSGGRKAVA